ncbi:phosphatidylinositol mannoside acyltransferase [Streptomyces xiaopingdaonensis]|uniref:phosphatidylinositol mannoside acyltransferase n=1 Tax=Streptomyces xiaopingdaonensis TaxID=1565415 RepID=UPI0002F6E59E|nr:phosphatidylinositol mannoside acyltransferase [Streptomyces xiaopingdaonensis]
MSGWQDRLTSGLYGAGWAGVRKLPEPTARRLGQRIADTAWKRRGKRVLRLESNLARVAPEADAEELARLSKAGMRSYLRYWMESFRLPVYSREQMAAAVDADGLDVLTEGLERGRGVVIALPHMANWDLAGAWAVSRLGIPLSTVAERLKPETLYDKFVGFREGLGMEVLPHTGGSAFGTLARRLRAGGLVCLVADRDLSASGVPVTFFGAEARMPGGPAMLALQTGAVLLPVTLWYDGTPVMKAKVHRAVEAPEEGDRKAKAAAMTQSVADVFAAGIAEHPEDWHMLQRFWVPDLEPRQQPAHASGEPEGAS